MPHASSRTAMEKYRHTLVKVVSRIFTNVTDSDDEDDENDDSDDKIDHRRPSFSPMVFTVIITK